MITARMITARMITAPLPRASPSGSGRLSKIIPRYYGLTITYSYLQPCFFLYC